MKKLTIALVMIAVLTTGAFAQIALGVTGAQYYQEDEYGNMPSLKEAWADFQDGTGVYWGGFGEIILGKMGVGIAFNQQTYVNEPDRDFDMWNYDVNLYLSYHIFGGSAFIDPFLEAGFGVNAYDYKNKDKLVEKYPTYTWSDDPLMGSSYVGIGAGIGINLGSVGIFTKVLWNKQSDEPLYTNGNEFESPIPELPIMPLKWFFGAKILL